MKLLFDANLSPRLVARLAELFPESMHVFQTGLERFTSDETIWEYVRANEFVIVMADVHFWRLAGQRGAPPKIVRIENCNYKTDRVADLIRHHAIRIAGLAQSAKTVLAIRNTS